MQTTIKEAVGLITYLEVSFPYLILIVFLTLLIIFIYSISSFFTKKVLGPESGLSEPLKDGKTLFKSLGALFRSDKHTP